MKYTLMFLVSLFSFTSFAQDCNNIKKEVDEMKGNTSFTSPIELSRGFYVTRTISSSNDFTGIVFHLKRSNADYSAKGIYIKFDDGTILKDEEGKVDCRYATDGIYRFSGVFIVDGGNVDALTTKKIVKFQLDDYPQELDERDSNILLDYIKCVKNAQ